MLAVRRSDASEPFHRALDFYHWPQWRDTAGEIRKVFSERLKNWVGKRYERCDLKNRLFFGVSTRKIERKRRKEREKRKEEEREKIRKKEERGKKKEEKKEEKLEL